MKTENPTSRRQFLKSMGLASAPLMMPTLSLGNVVNPSAPKDRPLRFALIGYGGRGSSLVKEAAAFGEIKAICDVDTAHLDRAWKEHKGVTRYSDFRQVLELDDVDAIICATVDHWHAQISVAAMKAGKDVYCEKPMTLCFAEGKPVIETQKQTGRILQVGSQQRSKQRFRMACEFVRNGRIGKLRHVEVVIPEGPRMFPFNPNQKVPTTLAWDMWKGQTPDVPYMEERTHLTFRYWWDYSGGTLTDWGVHHNDIAIWGAGLENEWPVKIVGTSLAPAIPGGFTADSRFKIHYTYADGLTIDCHTTPDSSFYGELLRPDGQGHGVKFVGDDGWIWVTRGDWDASDEQILREPLGEDAIRLYESLDHMRNFVESTLYRREPISTPEVGHRSAGLCHLGVISLRLGRALEFDPASETFVGDDEATGMLARPMREPYDWSFV